MKIKHPLFILSLLFTLGYAFAEKQYETNVRNILNDKEIESPYEKFRLVNDSIAKNIPNIPFEEGVALYYDLLLPFVEKNVKDELSRDRAKGKIFTNIFWTYSLHGYPGEAEENDVFLKKLVERADVLKNDTARANIYRGYGAFQSAIGNVPLAHEYYYKAMALYESIHLHERVFLCLYNIAEKMSETRDTAGFRKIIEQMEYYVDLPSFEVSDRALYHVYVARSIYYGILYEYHPETIAYNDAALRDNINALDLLERSEIKSSIIYYSYYNTASCYHKSHPEQYDSIYYFLDKALEYKTGYKYVDAELEINVYIFYAKLHFEQERYEQAEKELLYVLSLLEELDNNNTAMEYTETYKFLAKCYEMMKRPAEALKYYKLLLENEGKRYDNEKVVAMNDMLVKYETEKKQIQIQTLIKEQRILRLIIWLSLTLLTILLLIILLNRLKRKNIEQRLYETALLAELQQTEFATEKGQNAKQQLEQNRVKNTIEDITKLISVSLIETNDKQIYLQRLSQIDVKLLETAYQISKVKITGMDMKYLVCFTTDMDVKDISLLFNIEPASVHTVRYRIKKKFSKEDSFRVML